MICVEFFAQPQDVFLFVCRDDPVGQRISYCFSDFIVRVFQRGVVIFNQPILKKFHFAVS